MGKVKTTFTQKSQIFRKDMSEKEDESVESDSRPNNNQSLLQEIDFYAMALFIKILER